MEKSNIIGLLPNDLLTFLEMMSEPSYRSKQITHWLYQQKATTWDEMKNLPLGFRQVLSQRFDIGQIKIKRKWFHPIKQEIYCNSLMEMELKLWLSSSQTYNHLVFLP